MHVFTDTRFGGNQLAVLTEARGLSDRQMQQVAREFHFSESAFVLPRSRGIRVGSAQVTSVGLPSLVTELRDRSAPERARVSGQGFDDLVARGVVPDVHLYARSGDEFDIRARMSAPFDGVPEDPASGSANCALAGLLSHYGGATDGSSSWRIAQGVGDGTTESAGGQRCDGRPRDGQLKRTVRDESTLYPPPPRNTP